MSAIEVRAATTRADIEAFIDVAVIAQSGNPHWVAPVRDEVHWAFDPKKSAVARENRVRAFVAWQAGRPVGRIATIVNTAYRQKHDADAGQFGLVEGIDDPAVFAALIATAAADLKSQGLARMLGPFSLSINHETGVLVEGFDVAHVVRTNHAPPYYGRHLEAAGCRKAMDLLAATCKIAECDFPERVERLVAARRRDTPIETYGLSLASWGRQFPRVLDLYNDAWRNNWASIPVSKAEAKMIASLMLPVSKPSWIRMARYQGEPIAIVAQIPDVNEALTGLDGRLLPFGWAKLMWRIHGRGTRRSRLPMIGVASRWRGTRIGALAISQLLAEAIVQARKAGVVETEISWMLETNSAILNLVGSLPAVVNRRFRVYTRDI
jgi:GNAT superfamily N-acetyltransferase